MRKNGLFLFLFFIGLVAYGQINVAPVSDTNLLIKENTLVYFLPKKIINVKIDVETKHFIPGPFCKYAEKYLLIDNVSFVESVSSYITDIKLEENSIADPEEAYVILKNKSTIQFNEKGVIKAYNTNKHRKNNNHKYSETEYYNMPKRFDNEGVVFLDYGVKRNFIDITDTTYKVIELDSVFQKIPVYNTVITSKDFEQKAEEAANFIIKLRKRRFKLETGQFETEEPPQKLRYMIKRLDSLEKQYLELFIGKEIIVKNTFYTVYNPQKDKHIDKQPLFYLSDELGISKNKGKPVYLIATNENIVSEINNFYERQSKLDDNNKKKGLYYKIPGRGSIAVEYDNNEYAKKYFLIPQYGRTNYLPAKMFKNKKLKIIFNSKNGSIKRISNE